MLYLVIVGVVLLCAIYSRAKRKLGTIFLLRHAVPISDGRFFDSNISYYLNIPYGTGCLGKLYPADDQQMSDAEKLEQHTYFWFV